MQNTVKFMDTRTKKNIEEHQFTVIIFKKKILLVLMQMIIKIINK